MDFNALKFRVGIDVTPILAGGENGGAKIMTIELVKKMSTLARHVEFLILTSKDNHDELAIFDALNVKRLCIDERGRTFSPKSVGLKRMLAKVKSVARNFFFKEKVKKASKPLSVDVLFCPFTVSQCNNPEVPTVAIIYDLQYCYYPNFFSREDHYHREMNFKTACKNSSKLVCISDYVRQTVLDNSHFSPEQVETVHIQMPFRLPKINAAIMDATLQKFSVKPHDYFLYPANFWQHKNHEFLLTAFNIYCHRYPNSTLKLVCTGHPDQRMHSLQQAARKMGIAQRMVFPGFLNDEEFVSLIEKCKAVIFPSLYEGFGMPVLEAMAYAKPILCSKVASLPEVAGDAAIYFDPRKPETIVDAIHEVETNPELVMKLMALGKEQVAKFASLERMAKQYLSILADAVKNPNCNYQALQGRYADGWSSDQLTLVYGSTNVPRTLELTLSAPEWLPQKKITIKLNTDLYKKKKTFILKRNEKLVINHELPTSKGRVSFMIKPGFQPNLLGMSEDSRKLGCLVSSCLIKENDKVIELC